MPDLRLQTVDGEDQAPLRLQPLTPLGRPAHRERHQFVIPFQQIGNVALTDAREVKVVVVPDEATGLDAGSEVDVTLYR